MCIAFMHRKSGEFSRNCFKARSDQSFSRSDDLGLDHQVSVINFDMTFVIFLCFGGKQIEVNSNMNKRNSNKYLKWNLNYKQLCKNNI